ncbi:hypothetical protein GCM10010193_62330 [Kitasatospora atroaurantiaca]
MVECFIQDVAEFDRHQRVATRGLSQDAVNMEFLLHDPVEQAVTYQCVTFDAKGTTLRARPPQLTPGAGLCCDRPRARP